MAPDIGLVGLGTCFVDLTSKIFNSSRLPVILHSESSECGLASLAMVASYHGYRASLSELRNRFSVSLKGMTLKDIIKAANKLGISGGRSAVSQWS